MQYLSVHIYLASLLVPLVCRSSADFFTPKDSLWKMLEMVMSGLQIQVFFLQPLRNDSLDLCSGGILWLCSYPRTFFGFEVIGKIASNHACNHCHQTGIEEYRFLLEV